MRYTSTVLGICLLPISLYARVELPVWDDAAESGTYFLGGGLWPKSLIPTEEAAAAQPSPPAEGTGETAPPQVAGSETAAPATEGATAGTTATTTTTTTPAPTQFYGPVAAEGEAGAPDPSLQRVRENPDGTFVVPEEVVEVEAYEPLPPLEGELADLYFATPPVDYLIDPQRLLTEQKSNDIMRFLEFHADESPIRIFVMAVGENQKIPDGIDLQKLHAQWFSDSPTVLMLYFREQPQMTELIFNESIRNSLPKSVFDRILQNCLREGGVADLAPDQVEKMAIELSIQLYWLSRLMKQENPEQSPIAAASKVHELMASQDAPELLREYAPGIFINERSKVLSVAVTLVFVLGALAVFGLVGWIVLWWRAREGVTGEPLLFPDFQLHRRLGGEFSGGGFVGMSFEFSEGSS